ncbi:MAG TPA: hypothetical protein DDY43_15025 [Synechococcales bacterium UBA10510]|nr:hypothetical protein [Synechococcales bacterium UBA10510]
MAQPSAEQTHPSANQAHPSAKQAQPSGVQTQPRAEQTPLWAVQPGGREALGSPAGLLIHQQADR